MWLRLGRLYSRAHGCNLRFRLNRFKVYYALGEFSASFCTTIMSFPCEDWMKGRWALSFLLLQGDAEGDSVGAKPCNTQTNKTHNNNVYVYV